MERINKQTVLVCAVMYVVALAGCGGGGGGGGTGLSNTVTGHLGHSPAARSQAASAASATPQEGSVTQSSTVDGNNITEDNIEATATYVGTALRVSVTNQRSGSWGTVSTDDELVRSNNALTGSKTGDSYSERVFGKRVDNGVVLVDIYTDRVNAADTDYMVGGVWVLVPNDVDAVDDVEIGAFIDSPMALTPSSYLRTTATVNYDGDATGLYLGEDNGEVFAGEFLADVDLTASFRPSNPSIEGTVSNFQDVDVSRTVVGPIGNSPTLTLGAANIGNDDGGFFTGTTSGTAALSGESRSFSGKWGGQFFGDEAQRVGGTFGGQTTGTNYDSTFVGAFGAKKE